MSEFAPWVAIALAAASLLYSIFKGQSKHTAEKFIAIDQKIDALEDKINTRAGRDQVGILAGKIDLVEDRVTICQNDLKHLPDKDITHRLELSIAEMRTEMRGLAEQMKPIAAIAGRVQDAVMEKVMG